MSPQLHIGTPLASILACIFVVHSAERHSRREVAATLGCAAALWAAFQVLSGGANLRFPFSLASFAACLGFSSLLIVFVQACRTTGEEHKRLVRTFLVGGLFPLVWVGVGFALSLSATLSPAIDDHLLYAFDGTLGFQPSFVLGRLLQEHRVWLHGLAFIYEASVIPIAILYAFHRLQPKISVRLIPLWVSVILAGYFVYYLFPAIGPIYAFSVYPWHTVDVGWPVQPIVSASAVPRNCMPSIHLALALLVWWNSRGRCWWARFLAGIFVAATVVATLGLGEHYLADLVVALPFSLVFQAVWMTSASRVQRLVGVFTAAALSSAWLLLLRFRVGLFLRWPLVSWVAISATLLLCAGLYYNLNRATRPVTAEKVLHAVSSMS